MKIKNPKKFVPLRLKKKVLTLGDLVASTYAHNERHAREILRLAINSEIITFARGRHYSII